MPTVQRKVYLLTEEQRDGLMNYLMNRPYHEVANGVQFLTGAPSTILNIEVPEEQSASSDAEQVSKSVSEEEGQPETVSSAAEVPVLSYA